VSSPQTIPAVEPFEEITGEEPKKGNVSVEQKLG
jgi:hypothetical protein